MINNIFPPLQNMVLFAALLGLVFALYMIMQPDKGNRVRVFKEQKRDIDLDQEPSVIRNYVYTAGIDAITFQTFDGKSDHGKCMFIGNTLLALECESGRYIPKNALSATQIADIENIKGGYKK